MNKKDQTKDSERIAKALARAGIGSRRDVERMITAGRVGIDGIKLKSPAHNITSLDGITVDGKPVLQADATRLWHYHKPRGLVTTHRDPEGRSTVFAHLPSYLPRVISVGRLDLNSEGLLLLTNDGELARWMEMPKTGWIRRYKVRAFGAIEPDKLAALAKGTTIDGIVYEPIDVKVEKTSGSNSWLNIALREGKNREIRRVLASLGLSVNRLIRTHYGPFSLGTMMRGTVSEVSTKALYDACADMLGARPHQSIGAQERKAPTPSKWAKAKPRPKRPGARKMRGKKVSEKKAP